MAKYSFFLTLLSCLIFGSCQTIEQISIDYMMPAEINFPPELRRVAIVNNVSAIPDNKWIEACLLYTSPSPRDRQKSRMPSSA